MKAGLAFRDVDVMVASRPAAFMPKHYYRVILIALTVLCAVGALITMPFALFAGMAFDAPGSEHQLGTWLVFFAVLSIPLWFFVGAVGGWFLYLHDWFRMSLLITATPLIAITLGWLLLQAA